MKACKARGIINILAKEIVDGKLLLVVHLASCKSLDALCPGILQGKPCMLQGNAEALAGADAFGLDCKSPACSS